MFRRICSILLLCLWMGVIFSFSAQPAKKSSAVSGAVQKKVEAVVKKVFPKVDTNKPKTQSLLTKIVRKTAHFCLYFVLGILALFTCMAFRDRRGIWLLALLICILYAGSDEIHQNFVKGRSCEFLDVCIDTAGALFGIALLSLGRKILKRFRKTA